MEEQAALVRANVVFINVSVDLPYALKRFFDAENVLYARMLSDHRETSFGKDWGVLIKEIRLLTRALFIVDEENKIRYVQVSRGDLFSQSLDYGDISRAMKELGLIEE